NHYTLVTGLRPNRHGIVNNAMEDPAVPDVRFTMANKAAVGDGAWWDEGVPLWVTAEKAGIRTATMFWPGSEAEIHGVRPAKWAPFDQQLPSAARVDVLLGWLEDPAGRPGFATLYFDIVDTAGHRFGPGAPETDKALMEADAAIARLLEGLTARGLEANLVIVADHGMAPVPVGQAIAADAADPGAVRMVTGGPTAGFALIPGREARGEALLLRTHDHMACWRKGELPRRFAYGAHPRVPPIVCLAEVGWHIGTVESLAQRRAETRTTGAHGYDPAAPEMAALFLAWGPSIRRGGKAESLNNVDVYPLLARMIGVMPVEGDGKLPAGVLR
ncbi:MAG TPA: ectonucleotide pyrophosphatase/phosphodiesterase, partial [Caulobacter sp.]|nr:ectonucleotide pyrophosphatase/phosphodiesterase [Caulobacter sp.]